jgi:MFS family permease
VTREHAIPDRPHEPSADDRSRSDRAITTNIPSRMDRLPFGRFHLLVIAALGVTWVLDGLEVTIVGSIGPVLQDKHTLALTAEQVGTAASCYVGGAVGGALGFGWLTDRFGRRRMFNITLGIYLLGVLLTAFSWSGWSFALFRVVTGVGIGGEYASVNSAIDELIPARLRGRIDMAVNGSYWFGAAAGAAGSLLLLSGTLVSMNLGWRIGFGIGGVLGLAVIGLRRFVPESPRWLVTHDQVREAEKATELIEQQAARGEGSRIKGKLGTLRVHPRHHFGLKPIISAMAGKYRKRSALALMLMTAQAFLFNAVFFTYGLVLARFYQVPNNRVGLYILPLAISNFLGPVALGFLFDRLGRKRMITGSYGLTGVLLCAVTILFGMNVFGPWSQTFAWMAIFFVASAAASSAYMTASEIFPLETRSLAIAVFYAAGTAIGGGLAPWLFSRLIGSGNTWTLAGGYLVAAALMLAAAGAEMMWGVAAEGKSLESVAGPLSS